MVSCVAIGCTNRSCKKYDKKITYHMFPKNPERRKLWIRAVRRKDWSKQPPGPSKIIHLCCEHFTEDCFDRTGLATVRLRENAIPTVFPGFPSYLQHRPKAVRKPPKRRSSLSITTSDEKNDASSEPQHIPDAGTVNITTAGPSSSTVPNLTEQPDATVDLVSESASANVVDTPRKVALKRKLDSVTAAFLPSTMRYCCVYGCKSDSRRFEKGVPQGITFHRFPKNEKIRKMWVEKLRWKNWQPSNTSLVCSEHFAESDMDRMSQSLVRVREGAVPTIFKGFPAHLQKTEKKRKPPKYREPPPLPPICRVKSVESCSEQRYRELPDNSATATTSASPHMEAAASSSENVGVVRPDNPQKGATTSSSQLSVSYSSIRCSMPPIRVQKVNLNPSLSKNTQPNPLPVITSVGSQQVSHPNEQASTEVVPPTVWELHMQKQLEELQEVVKSKSGEVKVLFQNRRRLTDRNRRLGNAISGLQKRIAFVENVSESGASQEDDAQPEEASVEMSHLELLSAPLGLSYTMAIRRRESTLKHQVEEAQRKLLTSVKKIKELELEKLKLSQRTASLKCLLDLLKKDESLQGDDMLVVEREQVHFDESQYESHRKDGWRKLKPNAVPTIFNIPEPPKPSKPLKADVAKTPRAQKPGKGGNKTPVLPPYKKRATCKKEVVEEPEADEAEDDVGVDMGGDDSQSDEEGKGRRSTQDKENIRRKTPLRARKLGQASPPPSLQKPYQLRRLAMKKEAVADDTFEDTPELVEKSLTRRKSCMGTADGKVKCPLCCGEALVSLRALKSHLEWVMGHLQCPVCKDRFTSLKGMVGHLERHLMDREDAQSDEEGQDDPGETAVDEVDEDGEEITPDIHPEREIDPKRLNLTEEAAEEDPLGVRTDDPDDASKVPHDHNYFNKKTKTTSVTTVLPECPPSSSQMVVPVAPSDVIPTTSLAPVLEKPLQFKIEAKANGEMEATTTDPAALQLPQEVLQFILNNDQMKDRAGNTPQVTWCVVQDKRSADAGKPPVLPDEVEFHKHFPKRRAKSQGQFRCNRCRRVFRHPESLEQHQAEHAEQMSVCEKCGEMRPSLHELKVHMRSHRRKSYMRQCPLCEKVVSQPKFKAHLVTHREPQYQCTLCSKRFFFERMLLRHSWRHTGVKPHLCDVCGNSYSSTEQLRKHSLKHASTQFGQCEICGMRFGSTHHKKVHSTWHASQERRRFRCTSCSVDGMSLQEYRQHNEANHGGSPQFECDICQRVFKSAGSLYGHKKSRHVSPIYCPICGRFFSAKSYLSAHLEAHRTGKARYVCPDCGFAYSGVCAVKTHRLNHHHYTHHHHGAGSSGRGTLGEGKRRKKKADGNKGAAAERQSYEMVPASDYQVTMEHGYQDQGGMVEVSTGGTVVPIPLHELHMHGLTLQAHPLQELEVHDMQVEAAMQEMQMQVMQQQQQQQHHPEVEYVEYEQVNLKEEADVSQYIVVQEME